MRNDVWPRLDQTMIPVVTVASLDVLPSLIDRLQENNFKTVEVTLRTEFGLAAIRQIKQLAPEMIVGAGTILDANQVNLCLDAGAEYLVSPGWSDLIYERASTFGAAEKFWLPGVVTPTEVMSAIEKGFRRLKFFPAKVFGGISTLKAYDKLFPGVKFCPTGGVSAELVTDYLELDNVFAVGGTSWLT